MKRLLILLLITTGLFAQSESGGYYIPSKWKLSGSTISPANSWNMNLGGATGLFWDETNKRLGIGVINPQTPLVVSNGGAQGLEINPSSGIISGGVDLFSYNRTTSAYSPLKIDGSILALGYEGANPTGNVFIGYTSDPTSGNKFAVNGNIYGSGVLQTVGAISIGRVATQVLDIAPPASNAWAVLERPDNGYVSLYQVKTGSTADWTIGMGSGTSDLSIFSYGTTSNILTFARATGNATFAGSVMATNNYSIQDVNGKTFLANKNDTQDYAELIAFNTLYELQPLRVVGSNFEIATSGNATFVGNISLSTTSSTLGYTDAFFSRDAAGVFAQKNGVNNQLFRLYDEDNTGSNDRYLELGWLTDSSAVFRQAISGTKTSRPLNFTTFSSYSFDGNLGIGKAASADMLDINGAVTIRSANHSAYVADALQFDWSPSYGAARIQAGITNQALLLQPGGGNVGIGDVVAPLARLHTNGTAMFGAGTGASLTDSSLVVNYSTGSPVLNWYGTDGDTWNIGINTSDGATFNGATTYNFDNDVIFPEAGSSINSKAIKLQADNAATTQEGSIQVMYGADPYLRLSAPNDAGTATAILDLKDQRVVIGAGTDGVDYDLYWNGFSNQGSITYMEDEDRIDVDNDFKIGASLWGSAVMSGTNTFTTTATADTVAVTGATVNDIYMLTYTTAVTAAEAPLSVVATATGFIATRPAGTTSGAGYAWTRQRK